MYEFNLSYEAMFSASKYTWTRGYRICIEKKLGNTAHEYIQQNLINHVKDCLFLYFFNFSEV